MSEEGLDTDKIGPYADMFTEEISNLIISKPRSKEMTCGAIMALANLLVMITRYVMKNDKDKALDIITAAISKAMASAAKRDARNKEGEVVIYEISPDPKTPGK